MTTPLPPLPKEATQPKKPATRFSQTQLSNSTYKETIEPEIDMISSRLVDGAPIDDIPSYQVPQIIRCLKQKKNLLQDNPAEKSKIDHTIQHLASSARQAIFSNTKGFDIMHKKGQLEKLNVSLNQLHREQQNLFTKHLEQKRAAMLTVLIPQNEQRTSFMTICGQELPFDIRLLINQTNQLKEKELLARKADKNSEADALAKQALNLETKNFSVLASKYTNSSAVERLKKMLKKQHKQMSRLLSNYDQQWKSATEESVKKEIELNQQIDEAQKELAALIGSDVHSHTARVLPSLGENQSPPISTRSTLRRPLTQRTVPHLSYILHSPV